MAAGPVLEFEAGDALKLALIVGDESEPSGFGVSGNPEIIAADPLTACLERHAYLRTGFPSRLRDTNMLFSAGPFLDSQYRIPTVRQGTE